MIVSPGRRYIFVHIPKTGGTSLAAALETRAMADDLLIGDTPKASRRKRRLAQLSARGRLWKHSRLADLDGVLAPGEIDGMFVFTLVRNPWDRMVSYYAWAREQSFDHPAIRAARRLDFGGFVADPAVGESLRRSPARSYVTDAAGCERCDAFVRLESLETDLVPVWEHLGFRLELPRLNASGRKSDYRSYYDAPARRRVAELHAEDIDRFGYAW